MNPQDMADIQAYIKSLGPNAHVGSEAGLDPQAEMLQQQLARAHAMRMQQRQSYGALAGAGNGLASIFGAIHENQLEGQQADNIKARQAAQARLLMGGQPDAQVPY